MTYTQREERAARKVALELFGSEENWQRLRGSYLTNFEVIRFALNEIWRELKLKLMHFRRDRGG